MDIFKATKQYEQWIATYTPLVQADLKFKHQQMASAAFPFLRSAFYRWAQLWPAVCKEAAKAPSVLAVGDLHVENFGTWRDAEGRLIWGVNDFDEACYLPYTNDLTRLAVSALLAIEADHLRLEGSAACDALLSGYAEGLEAGGKPFVLAESNIWLRNIAGSSLRNPAAFWQQMEGLPAEKAIVPESAIVALEHILPAKKLPYQLKPRRAGLGSLGHPRYVALADWEGGKVAREAKALVPSANVWAKAGAGPVEIYYQAIVDKAVRCRDPFVALQGHWIARRLAPDCSRIELSSLPEERSETELLHAMGWETANIHLGTKGAAPAIKKDLKQRKKGWLQAAANAMTEATLTDWKAWKAG